MYKAGHLIRRSSVRIKSFSTGHSPLLMIISQIREVRGTFKSFLAAQSILSEDLLKWSCSIDNEAIHETFSYLSELSSLWTEVQKDFVDNLKHFRSNFDMILEGEKHVDQAKQVYTSREESERDVRREIQKSYKKAPTEEMHLLRDRLNKAEKSKELAHLEVVDRIRENEAVKMIRVKEGMRKYGESFFEMIQKANVIFTAQQKIVSELPDVHDKALHSMKYRGHVCADYVQEAKELTRQYRRSSIVVVDSEDNKNPFYDPPPPYSPVSDNMNDLTRNLSHSSLKDASMNYSKSSSLNESNEPSAPSPLASNIYPRLNPSPSEDVPSASGGAERNATDSSIPLRNGLDDSLPHTKLPLLPLKATRLKKKKLRRSLSPSLAENSPASSLPNSKSSSAILSWSSYVESPADNATRTRRKSNSPFDDDFGAPAVSESAPPYNPFYEWSEFPVDNK